MLDATCAPADISYPTDLKLLNEAREKLEAIIDVLHEPFVGKSQKPRTYRQTARKRYLEIAKKRRAGSKSIRKAIGKQLRYVSRNLRIIEMLAAKSSLNQLSTWQYRQLLIISELYRQQQEMYDKRSHSVEDRIVSLSQPHVRPIVRGKVNAPVEFGAKLAISLVDGYARMEKLSWDNFNESMTLKAAVDAYVQRYGHRPATACHESRTQAARSLFADFQIAAESVSSATMGLKTICSASPKYNQIGRAHV